MEPAATHPPGPVRSDIGARVSLDRKVAFLRRPEVYTPATRSVEAIQTHMAWVFLTDRRAYKLKKPVRYAFLDFSTLESRRHCCEEEVRLNRRLAPDVYLGTAALTARGDTLAIGGAGEVVDWLVVMRRLDRELMLDRLIERGSWTADGIADVAAWLVRFYTQVRHIDMTPSGYRSRLEIEVEEDRREILALEVLGEADVKVDLVANRLLEFIRTRGLLLDARVAADRIVEGHGDLRPEHVFVGPPPAVIDCIEFNESFRVLDPVDDLAFLRLECERLGAPEAGRLLFEAYGRLSGDAVPDALVAFHCARRALLRAKIALWHLRDDEFRGTDAWVDRGLRYLALAEVHSERALQ